jgi:CRT-like, chloroquine-resistance transporter-like
MFSVMFGIITLDYLSNLLHNLILILQNKTVDHMKDFPHSKLIVMATLDTIQFAGLTVSAAGISPAMTVILLHTSTPFLVLGSRYAFPDRKYSVVQMRGVQLIALSVLISLVGSMTHMFLPGVHESDTASSLLYFSMSALHGKALFILHARSTAIDVLLL